MPISLPRPTTARKAKGPAAPSAGQDQDGASGASPDASGPDASVQPAGPDPIAAPPVSTDRSTAIYGHDAGNGDILEIPVKLIAPNPHNDRDTGDVSAEAAHIKVKGLLQPISVMRAALYLAQWEESLLANPRTAPLVPAVRDAQWVIVFGERRWLATTEAGLKKIDAIVRDDLIEDSEEIITAENLLRKNPSPLEEARQFRRFVDEKGMSYADVELVSGRSKGHISKRIALLSYSPTLQTAIRDGSVGPTSAKEVADAVPDHELQAAVVRVMLGDPPVHYQTAIAAVLAGRTDLVDAQSGHLPEQGSLKGAETSGADTGQGAGSASHGGGSERPHETDTSNGTASAGHGPGQLARQKATAKPTKEQQQAADRRAAATARANVCRDLLKASVGIDSAPLVNSVFLTRFNQTAAHATAYGWLQAAGVAEVEADSAANYFPAVLDTARPELIAQAVLAVALAGAEIRASDQRRAGYDTQDKAYIEFLRAHGGYTATTAWELEQLGLSAHLPQPSVSPEGSLHV